MKSGKRVGDRKKARNNNINWKKGEQLPSIKAKTERPER